MTLSLNWSNEDNCVVLTRIDGVHITLKVAHSIRFKIPNVYGSPQYGAETVVARIEGFIGDQDSKRFWGVIYTLSPDFTPLPSYKTVLADIHYNDDIWNTVEYAD